MQDHPLDEQYRLKFLQLKVEKEQKMMANQNTSNTNMGVMHGGNNNMIGSIIGT